MRRRREGTREFGVQETDRPAISRFEGTHRRRSETRDGMHIDWDVQIEMDDGLVLRADVSACFRHCG
jgi:hypothetical protein